MELTLDTCVLIVLLDNKPGSEDVQKLLNLHNKQKIKLYISNRVFEHDTRKMHDEQKSKLYNILEENKIEIMGNKFRLSFSELSGKDLASGCKSVRTMEQMNHFAKLVGRDPIIQYLSSRTISNKLGDHDSLEEHFASGRDVFVTYDNKHYFDMHNRKQYAEELGLIIQTPAEFLGENFNLLHI